LDKQIFFKVEALPRVPYCRKTSTLKGILSGLKYACLSGPGANVDDRPFLADIELTFALRIAITSFFKMLIPLKVFLKQNIRIT